MNRTRLAPLSRAAVVFEFCALRRSGTVHSTTDVDERGREREDEDGEEQKSDGGTR